MPQRRKNARSESVRGDRILRSEISDGVLGIQAPVAAAKNWPSVVLPDHFPHGGYVPCPSS
jgi:hypothetical protein